MDDLEKAIHGQICSVTATKGVVLKILCQIQVCLQPTSRAYAQTSAKSRALKISN